MAKASSTSKVARVARSGGTRTRRESFRPGFGAAVVGVFLIGVLLVAWAWASRDTGPEGPVAGDTLTATVGVYLCDAFVPDVGGTVTVDAVNPDVPELPNSLAGWASTQDGLEIGASSFTLPDGTVVDASYECDGEQVELSARRWDAGSGDDDALVATADVGGLTFTADNQRFTVAAVPADTPVPPPTPTATGDDTPSGDTPSGSGDDGS